MRKIIFWIGLGVFLLAIVCGFLAGATSGPSIEQAKPTVPFLYGTSQILWLFLTAVGLITVIVGLILKKKT